MNYLNFSMICVTFEFNNLVNSLVCQLCNRWKGKTVVGLVQQNDLVFFVCFKTWDMRHDTKSLLLFERTYFFSTMQHCTGKNDTCCASQNRIKRESNGCFHHQDHHIARCHRRFWRHRCIARCNNAWITDKMTINSNIMTWFPKNSLLFLTGFFNRFSPTPQF